MGDLRPFSFGTLRPKRKSVAGKGDPCRSPRLGPNLSTTLFIRATLYIILEANLLISLCALFFYSARTKVKISTAGAVRLASAAHARLFNACCASTPFLIAPDPSQPTQLACSECEKDADWCAQVCPDGQVCDGTRCVDCYASSQCACGICEPTLETCIATCQTNSDCAGNACCVGSGDDRRQCQPGRCATSSELNGCDCSLAALTSAQVDNNTLDPQS